MSKQVASIPVVLPEGESRRTQCVDCVRRRLEGRPGIRQVTLDSSGTEPVLRLDYDPKLVTLAALEREVQGAKGCLDPHHAHIMLRIEGIHSVDAERAIERALFGLPSVYASASYSSGSLRLEFDRRQCPLPEIVRRLDRLGYRTVSSDGAAGIALRVERRPTLASRLAVARQLARAHAEMSLVLLGGLFLIAGWLVGLRSDHALDAWGIARITLLLLSAICTSTETGPEAWQMLRRFKLDVDVLMFAAAIGASALGHYEEGALLLFLFGLGSAGEHLALSRARASIEALTKLAPDTATLLLPGGEQREVGVKEVSEGDRVLVKPFEKIPVDAVVEDGASTVDQSSVTGESIPAEKAVGSDVFAGTINGGGRLVVRCTKPASKSALARIIQLVEEAQSTKSSTQVFTDKVEHYYVPCVFVATAGLIFLPPLLGLRTWGPSFYNAMAFLTAASPCALAIGTPAAVLCAIARAARIGVLIKGGVHLENLGTVRAVALDKTGTLTTGKLSVTDIISLDPAHVPHTSSNGVPPTPGYGAAVLREATPRIAAPPSLTPAQQHLLSLAAAVEASSNHPLALAVVAHAKALGVDFPHADDLEQLAALGVRGRVGGRTVFAGKPSSLSLPPELAALVNRLKDEGRALVAVAVDDRPLGVIALADTPRPAARDVVARLHKIGVTHAVMLTGDHHGAAKNVAAATGIDAVHADLLPEDKLRLLNEITRKYGPVAMVGDGVNDAPALAHATVGIAMGGAASDVAMETADVVLLSDDLSRLPAAFALARRARRIIAQNLAIALGVIAIVAPLSALGFTKLSVAVLLHEGSTIVVVLNSLRLLRPTKD